MNLPPWSHIPCPHSFFLLQVAHHFLASNLLYLDENKYFFTYFIYLPYKLNKLHEGINSIPLNIPRKVPARERCSINLFSINKWINEWKAFYLFDPFSASPSSSPTRTFFSISFLWSFSRIPSRGLFFSLHSFPSVVSSIHRCQGIRTALSYFSFRTLHSSSTPLTWCSFQNSDLFRSFCLNHFHWFLFPILNNTHNLFSPINRPLQCGCLWIF